jgi:hypothetical protein
MRLLDLIGTDVHEVGMIPNSLKSMITPGTVEITENGGFMDIQAAPHCNHECNVGFLSLQGMLRHGVVLFSGCPACIL